MTKVISANYRDRDSSYRWLVRDESQAPEQAVACKQVRVLGKAQFTRSSHYEEGFGCKVVMETNAEVHMEDIEPISSAKELQFDGFSRFIDQTGSEVRRVQAIELKSDGKILATLA